MKKNKYRICIDSYAGYEVQMKRWWFPVWFCIRSNTFSTVERAEAYAVQHAKGYVKFLGVL